MAASQYVIISGKLQSAVFAQLCAVLLVVIMVTVCMSVSVLCIWLAFAVFMLIDEQGLGRQLVGLGWQSIRIVGVPASVIFSLLQ